MPLPFWPTKADRRNTFTISALIADLVGGGLAAADSFVEIDGLLFTEFVLIGFGSTFRFLRALILQVNTEYKRYHVARPPVGSIPDLFARGGRNVNATIRNKSAGNLPNRTKEYLSIFAFSLAILGSIAGLILLANGIRNGAEACSVLAPLLDGMIGTISEDLIQSQHNAVLARVRAGAAVRNGVALLPDEHRHLFFGHPPQAPGRFAGAPHQTVTDYNDDFINRLFCVPLI